MAQAAHSPITGDIWFRPPANDNGPHDKSPDLWHMLITRWKACGAPSLAVLAAQRKLSGQRIDDFILEFFRAAKRAGWEEVQDAEV